MLSVYIVIPREPPKKSVQRDIIKRPRYKFKRNNKNIQITKKKSGKGKQMNREKKKQNRASVNCGTTLSCLMFVQLESSKERRKGRKCRKNT